MNAVSSSIAVAGEDEISNGDERLAINVAGISNCSSCSRCSDGASSTAFASPPFVGTIVVGGVVAVGVDGVGCAVCRTNSSVRSSSMSKFNLFCIEAKVLKKQKQMR